MQQEWNGSSDNETYDRASSLRQFDGESVDVGDGVLGTEADAASPEAGFTAMAGLVDIIETWWNAQKAEIQQVMTEIGSARRVLEQRSPRLANLAHEYEVDSTTLETKSIRWLTLAEERLSECGQCVSGKCARSTGMREGLRPTVVVGREGAAVLLEERCPKWVRYLEEKRLVACGVPLEMAPAEFHPAEDGVVLAQWVLSVGKSSFRGQCFVNAKTLHAAERQAVAAVGALLKYLPRARIRYVDAHEARQALKKHFDENAPDPLGEVTEADVAVIAGIHERTLPFVMDAVDQVLATRRRRGLPTAVVASSGKPDDVLSRLCSLRV